MPDEEAKPPEPVTEPVESQKEPEKEPVEKLEPTKEQLAEKLELTKEQLSEIVASAVSEGIQKKDEEYKAKQRDLSRKDREEKKKAQHPSSSLTELSKAFAEAIESAGGDPAEVKKLAGKISQQAEEEQRMAEWEDFTNDKWEGYRDQLATVGIDPDTNRNLQRLFKSAKRGAIDFDDVDAEVKAMTIEKEKKVESEKKPEVESNEKPAETQEPTAAQMLAFLKDTMGIDFKGDTGGPAGAISASLKALTEKDTKNMSFKEQKEHKQALENALRESG